MSHPHISSSEECQIQFERNELACDNTPRLQRPRLTEDEKLEFTCPTATHQIEVSELSDSVLETVTRRLFENQKEYRDAERERLLAEISSRGLSISSEPSDITWNVLELTEEDVKTLEEEGYYPEAYQMAQVVRDAEPTDEMRTRPDLRKVMLVSDWALTSIPNKYKQDVTTLETSEYERSYF